MGLNDMLRVKAEQELAELRKKSANAAEVDNNLDAALTRFREEVRGYDAKYGEQAPKKKEAFEKKRFSGSWDPKLTEALEIVRKPLQAYGENCEKAAAKLLKAIEMGLESGASQNKATRCVDAALGALEKVENCTVYFYRISRTLKYYPTTDGRSTKRSLEKIQRDLSAGAGTIESQIKMLENKLIRIRKADRYGIALEKLDTHEAYLAAAKNYDTALTGDQLRACARELKPLGDYLNSKVLYDECEKRVNAIEEMERAEKTISDAKRKASEAVRDLKAAENEAAGSDLALKLAETELQKRQAEADHEKAAAMEEYNIKCAENDAEVARLNDDLTSLETQKSEAETALSKTFVLAFGKKKDLNSRITSLSASISEKKDNIEKTEKKKDEYLQTRDRALNSSDKIVADARKIVEDASAKQEAAMGNLKNAKAVLEHCRAELEKANQNYSAAEARKKEKEAVLEAEIRERKERERAEEAKKREVAVAAETKERKERERTEEEAKMIEKGAALAAEFKEWKEKKGAEAANKKAETEVQQRSIISSQTDHENKNAPDSATYRPGNEPEAIKRRLATLFEKLDAAYPDKVVVGLYADHKHWGETVTELYRKLGYESSTAFLNAYGYTVAAKTGKPAGRPASVDPAGIVAFLRNKYADGPVYEKFADLVNDNPELAGNLKTINNQANTLFGASLKDYFVQQGILIDPALRREEANRKREEEKKTRELEKQLKLDVKQAEQDRIAAAKKELEDRKNEISEELMRNCGIEFQNVGFVITDPDFEMNYHGISGAIAQRGGLQRTAVTGKTRFVIAPHACDTVKYQAALEYQAQGSNIVIMNQKQFFEAVAKYDAYVASSDVLERASQIASLEQSPDEPTSSGLVVQGDTLTAYRGSEKRIAIPDGIKLIGENAFAGSRVEFISMPDSVIAIEDNAFHNCKMLSQIKWSANLQRIGDHAFEFCKRLTELDLSNAGSLGRIGKRAFAHCYSLEKIELPDSLKTIEDGCFEKCVRVKAESMTIPSDIRLGDNVFKDCISIVNASREEEPNEVLLKISEDGSGEIDVESSSTDQLTPATNYALQLARMVSDPVASIVFEGKIFVHTSCKNEAKIDQLIVSKGGIVKSSTVQKTDYLIIGDKTDHETTKISKAKELNEQGKTIRALTESEFWSIVNRLSGTVETDDKDSVKESLSEEEESEEGIAEVSGNNVTLEENDIALEGVHCDNKNTMVVVAYRINPEKLRPRFAAAIKKYEDATGRLNNQCVLLAIIGDFSEFSTIPTFYSLLVFLGNYSKNWFEGDWLDSERYLCDECTELQESEDFIFDNADRDFKEECGMDMGSYLDQFVPGLDLSAWEDLL